MMKYLKANSMYIAVIFLALIAFLLVSLGAGCEKPEVPLGTDTLEKNVLADIATAQAQALKDEGKYFKKDKLKEKVSLPNDLPFDVNVITYKDGEDSEYQVLLHKTIEVPKTITTDTATSTIGGIYYEKRILTKYVKYDKYGKEKIKTDWY